MLMTGFIVCAAAVAARADELVYFVLEAAQVVPSSGSSLAGRALATLAPDESTLAFIIEHDIPAPLTATVHRAPRGSTGPVVFTFASSTSLITEEWTLSPTDVQDFRDGLLYVEIASSAFPDGDLRGQVEVKPVADPGDIIVSEIMYNPSSSEMVTPSAAEWIELFNPTFSDIAIGGWYFQDEDGVMGDPCTPARSGSIPAFVLHSGHVVVVLPDGQVGSAPTVAEFKAAWNRPDIDVLQLNADGTAEGGMTGWGLANDPRDDGNAGNDLPLANASYLPCNLGGAPRPDNEILVLHDGNQTIDVVNYDDRAPWPEDTGFSSITLVTGDYPDITDISTYSADGNDMGANWRSHTLGDAAGGFTQAANAGVYAGSDIGSPGYLAGATPDNQPPVAVHQAFAMMPGETVAIGLHGEDATRPLFGLLLFIIKTLPQHGVLIDVGSNHVITPADIAGNGYVLPRFPLNAVRYIHDGSCNPDAFNFSASDALLESNVATVELLVQCGTPLITEIMHNPNSVENEPALTEWVELYNPGPDPIDLAGWSLATRETRSGDLPPYVLGAGSTVVVIPPDLDPHDFAVAWCGASDASAPCAGDVNVLELRPAGPQRRFVPGDVIEIELHQSGLDQPVRGFQAFLQFDETRMTYLQTIFEPSPFGLMLANSASGGAIDLAAGVNSFIGQTPTNGSALLARIQFVAGSTEGPVQVSFRPHTPATRFTGNTGAGIEPCLHDTPRLWIDLTPQPQSCPIIQPTLVGQIGPGGIVGGNLSNSGEALRLQAPGLPVTIADAVVYDDGSPAGSGWPDVAMDGPSLYLTPPASHYDSIVNDSAGFWAAAQSGVHLAYQVTPTAIFNASDAAPPYASVDTGSPTLLAGVVAGDCGASATPADSNGDGLINATDYAHFAACFHGPAVAPPGNCICMDADGDGDVDFQDFAAFGSAYGGP
jgi:hypothetical protein